MTAQTAVQNLIDECNGQYVSVTGPDSQECTAIPHKFEQNLGLDIVYGNAKDTYAAADPTVYEKTDNIAGDSSNFPLPGAIVVWNANWGGGYGHTGVVVSADGNTMQVLEQNDGENGITHIGEHNYQDVIGWFRARVLDEVTEDDPMNAQQETDAYHIILNRDPDVTVPDNRSAMQFIYDAQGELTQQRMQHTNEVQSLENQINDVRAQLETCQQALTAAQQSPAVPSVPPVVPVPVAEPVESTTQGASEPANPSSSLPSVTHDNPNWAEVETQKVVNWFGTTQGMLTLQVAGSLVGWAVAHLGVPVSDWALSILGVITGTTISNVKNPSIPNSTRG